jgi:phosphoribosylanthranilate isomerase
MGVDLLGFRVVAGQPNHIAIKTFQEIRGWVTGPRIVAEVYGITHRDELTSILENYRPDILELGKKELQAIKGDLPLPCILSIDSGETAEANDAAFEPDYILVGERSDIPKLANHYEILLTIEKKDDLQQVDQQYIHGIALNGSEEIKTGLKDYNALSEILEDLDEDN